MSSVTHQTRSLCALVVAFVMAGLTGCVQSGPNYLDPATLASQVQALSKKVGSTSIVSMVVSRDRLMVRFARNGQQIEARAWDGYLAKPAVLNPLSTPIELSTLNLRELAAEANQNTDECTDPLLYVEAFGPGQGTVRLTCKRGVRRVWWASDGAEVRMDFNSAAGLAEAFKRGQVGMPTVTKVSVGSGRSNSLSVFAGGQDFGLRVTLKDRRVPGVNNYGHDGPAFAMSQLDATKIHTCAARLMLLARSTVWFADIYARPDGQIVLAFDVPGGWYPSGEGTALNQDCQEVSRF